MLSIKKFSIFSTFALIFSVITTQAHSEENLAQNWQGFYGGLALGGAYNTTHPDTEVLYSGYFVDGGGGSSDRAQLNPILQKTLKGWDLTGSALVGYDFQSGNITYGIEGDLTLMDYSESKGVGTTIYDTNADTFTTDTTVKTNFMISLRPKIGYVVGNFQLYASTGISVSRFKMTHNFSDTSTGTDLSYSDTKTAFGISSSVGANYRINNGWALRGEYIFNYYPNVFNGQSEYNGDAANDFNYGGSFQSNNIRFAVIKKF